MTNKEIILKILRNVKPTKNLEKVQDIIEGGYIDSFELMYLISELGEEFGVEIGVDEISIDNFNSVEAMTAMVERLMKKHM